MTRQSSLSSSHRQPRPSLVRLLLSCLLLAGVFSSCGPGEVNPYSQTLTPMSASVRGTATARAANAGAVNDLATAVAAATQRSAEVYATRTAQADLSSAEHQATVTAMAPVVAELPLYGIDPADGYVGWIHDPLTLELTGYMTSEFANDYPLVTAADFVLAADITWNAIGSLSGCGFMFRSNGDPDEPDQYNVFLTRTSGGYLVFMATADGDIANFHYFYPKDNDKSFNWFNEATNRLAVVARGDLIDMYTNGEWIGQSNIHDPPENVVVNMPVEEVEPFATDEQVAQYESMASQNDDTVSSVNAQISTARANFASTQPFYYDGLLGLLAVNESGTATCTFSNAWLFILNP